MSLDSFEAPTIGAPTADLLQLTVAEIRDETHDVTTFTFRPEGGVPRYAAGQSMTLKLSIGGETLFRTFSLASAPDGSGTITMTIKAHAKGRVTRWLHDELVVGARLEGRLPKGCFTIDARMADRIALVSAGSGASPLMAMLRHLAAAAPETDVHWLHAARTLHDIFFARELAELQARMPHLKVAMLVSRPEPGWFGFVGRLGWRQVSVALPDYGSAPSQPSRRRRYRPMGRPRAMRSGSATSISPPSRTRHCCRPRRARPSSSPAAVPPGCVAPAGSASSRVQLRCGMKAGSRPRRRRKATSCLFLAATLGCDDRALK